jgi:DNA-binding transcriptional ArsR family regulator
MNNKNYFIFFGNLANPLRIGIISILKEKERDVNGIAKELGMEQSKISHALARLKECNIVEVKSNGKQRIYFLNKNTILPILSIIDKHSKLNCGGQCKFCSQH